MPEYIGMYHGKSANFVGVVNNLDKPGKMRGDLVVCNNATYMWTDTKWEMLAPVSPTFDPVPMPPRVRYHTQCRNCSAPTDAFGRCSYCGTINKEFI